LQHARGDYLYVMDGDMRLQAGFIQQAMTFMAQHPEVAGAGGTLIECNDTHLEYRERTLRMMQNETHRVPGPVDRLDGGALYRRHAIAEVGYLSDRNLHSYEEFDLAARLRARSTRPRRRARATAARSTASAGAGRQRKRLTRRSSCAPRAAAA
jgi:GT2 family glycosyltransferase